MPDPVYPVLHYAKQISEKKAAYAEYHRVRNEMKELLTVKANADLILGVEPEETKREKLQERWASMKGSVAKRLQIQNLLPRPAFMVIEV